ARPRHHHAKAEAQVAQRRLDQRQAAPVAVRLLHALDAVEAPPRRPPRLIGTHPTAPVLFGLHLQVRAYLVVKLALQSVPQEQRPQAVQESSQASHLYPSDGPLKLRKLTRSAAPPRGPRRSLAAPATGKRSVRSRRATPPPPQTPAGR